MTEKTIPVITYQLQGPYNYELDQETGDYIRRLGDRDIGELVEHALQDITPYTHVRIAVEVW